MNWHTNDDVKKLAIQIERLKDLRDVSQLVVADSDSFHDNQIMFRALSLFGVYLILGTICYDLYFRDCNDTAPTDMETNRMANGTANFIENNLNDVTNIGGNMEQLASDITEQGCTRVTSWTSFLDAMVFQFTSFTTVGFGTHPRNFEDDASMVRSDGTFIIQNRYALRRTDCSPAACFASAAHGDLHLERHGDHGYPCRRHRRGCCSSSGAVHAAAGYDGRVRPTTRPSIRLALLCSNAIRSVADSSCVLTLAGTPWNSPCQLVPRG